MSIKKYDVLSNEIQHVSVPFNYTRGSAAPIDNSMHWSALSAAENYAKGELAGYGVPYVGQIITVEENNSVVTYVIENDAGNLKKVGDTESLNPTIDALSDAISANIDNISVISSDLSALALSVDAIKDATMGELGDLEKSLTESLSINISESAGTTDGILKTYTFSQGGKDLDIKINIPKDFLVKSAKLETVVAEDIAEDGKLFDQGFAIGDKYIDFTVNAKADASEESHVYLNVKDLVDVYTGSEGSIVDIAVEGTTIKATVKANSIGFAQLCSEVKEYIDTQDAATYLSAKNYADTQDAATYLSATNYVDGVSAALSDDYVKKIGDAQTAAIEKAMEVSSAASAYTDAQIAAHDTAAKELLAQVSADAVTSALTDAKDYTDEKIGAIDYAAFAMLSDLESLSNEVSAISTDLKGQIEQTLIDAKAYANDTSANALTNAKAYANDTSANALTDAKAYTDELCGSISVTVDQKIADLNIGQYAISSDVKAELCAVSAETLVSANAYTDKKVSDEVTARTEAIQALSDALSGDVKTLAEDYGKVKAEYAAVSADYKAVSADHEGRIDTLESGTSALSGRMNKVESDITSISSNYATKQYVNDQDAATLTSANKYTDDAIANIGTPLRFVGVTEDEKLSANSTISALSSIEYVGGAIKDGDVALNTKNGTEYVWNNGKWHEIGDENNHATKAELTAEETAREAADSFLSGKIDEISANYATTASVGGIKTELEGKITTETNARTTADSELSTAIDNKVFINGISAESLAVVNISQDAYHTLVEGNKIDPNTVYIVSSDTYNMYDQKIINLAPGTEEKDAVNFGQLSSLSGQIMTEVETNKLSSITIGDNVFTPENNNITLTFDVISCGGADL